MKAEELKEILGKMLKEHEARSQQVSTDHKNYMPDEWYEPLKKLGLVEEDYILSDKYYDSEAVHFAWRVLHRIGD